MNRLKLATRALTKATIRPPHRYQSNKSLAKLLENIFELEPKIDPTNLTWTNFQQTQLSKEPISSVKLLTRDFIDDSLYNPNYGYFSKQAVIYSPENKIELTKLKDSLEFMNQIALRYKEIELDLSQVNDISRQCWHTPTELFNPYYGYAIGNYIIQSYLKNGYDKLVIYEMGGGNGTLMKNIMEFIRMNYKDIYDKTEYNIIEISQQLSQEQEKNNQLELNEEMKLKCKVVNCSIFDWENKIEDNGYFIGMEVLDNFAHDVIKLNQNGEAYEEVILIDKNQQYEQVYQPVQDNIISEYLTILKQINCYPQLEWQYQYLPFQKSLSKSYFLPTKQYQFLKIIQQKFAKFHLILADFYELKDTVEGDHGPVVQTRFQNTMIPCKSYLVRPGWFDIFFPTNFEIMAKDNNEEVKVLTQNQFLSLYGDIKNTTTKSGENPFLDYYQNNKFLLT
ncbi:DUF185-domain-containing protein [Neoconidiobolus thromboides FSU 785]|nr:DUF185-domain-containing protein [Neoconidiobolus thromboides FSU 785]